MTNIATTLLPIAPATPDASTPGGFGNEPSGGGNCFESLLQMLSAEPMDGQNVPVEEPANAAVEPETGEVLAESGVLPVLPVAVDFAEPVAVVEESEGTDLAPVEARGRTNDGSLTRPLAPEVRGGAAETVRAAVPHPPKFREEKPHEAKPSPASAPAREVASTAGLALRAPGVGAERASAAPAPAPVASIRAIGGERAAKMAPVRLPEVPAVAEAGERLATAPEFGGTDVFDSPAAPAGNTIPVARRDTAAVEEPVARTPVAITPGTPAPVVDASIARNPQVEKFTGMTAAKAGDTMPAATLQRSPKIERATSAEPVASEAAPAAVMSERAQTLREAPAPAARNAREDSPNDRAENPDGLELPEVAGTHASSRTATAEVKADAAQPIRAADIAQVVERTVEATARLRPGGPERVEVAVKLESGHELTIQLRVANGEVTPVIRTESEPLRAALEENWSLFAQRTGDREWRVSTPVFESPQTSSDLSDSNPQRDGRQRAFYQPAPDFSEPPPRRNAPRRATPGSAPAPGVRLYA